MCVLYFFETLQEASQPVSTAQQRFHVSVLSFKSLVALFPQCCFYTHSIQMGKILKKTSEGVEFLHSLERWKEQDCENASNCWSLGKKIPRVNKISNVWVLDLYEKMMTERINDDLVNKWKVRSELEQYKTALRVCGGDVSRWRWGGKRHKFWILNTSPTSFITNEETTPFSCFLSQPCC